MTSGSEYVTLPYIRLQCSKCVQKGDNGHLMKLVPKTTEPIKAVAFWKCKCGEYNVIDLEETC